MTNKNLNEIPPSGIILQHTLKEQVGQKKYEIYKISWSPNGQMIYSISNNIAYLWNAKTGELVKKIDKSFELAWSPDSQILSAIIGDKILLFDTKTGEIQKKLDLPLQTRDFYSASWSPDGKRLVIADNDKILLLNPNTGKIYKKMALPQIKNPYFTWSPDSQMLAMVLNDQILLIDANNLKIDKKIGIPNPTGSYELAWSPDGKFISFKLIDIGSNNNNSLFLWEVNGGALQTEYAIFHKFTTVFGQNMKWSPDGRILAYSQNETLRMLSVDTMNENILEGHTEEITCISFSFDGSFISTKAVDETIRIWNCDTLETVTILYEKFPFGKLLTSPISFNPKAPILATLGEENKIIRIWELDYNILSDKSITPSVHYTNAKVVLVGDTGVGKSGLGLVLSGEPFIPTESSYGRRVWKLDNIEVDLFKGYREIRETLLWDLAGQPGYRLIHQLYLNEVAIALLVFDARSETDPFAGVHYWNRALRQAQRIQSSSIPMTKIFLIAARTDRGGIGVSRKRIDSLVEDLGFEAYFETSSKDGRNISALADAIRKGIDWKALPKVSSTQLFQCIKAFLIEEKENGRVLSTANDLYSTFLKTEEAPDETEKLYEQFETCIRLVESRGLIKRLSFGNLILLQPELLDAYASAMVNEAKEEPEGLGCIPEENARAGRFRMSEDERIKDKEKEKLLLIATIEDLLSYEIALREPAEDGLHLVFPSQFTREWSEAPDPEGKAVIFHFAGAVLNIYSTLAVRLSHSGMFIKKEMWKNAVVYNAKVGGECGFFLRQIGEGRGELTLFYNSMSSEETRLQFEEYVHTHLQRRALNETIHRQRIFECSECGESITERQAKRRRERGFKTIKCPVCENSISLLDREERLTVVLSSTISEMDRFADNKRELETAASILEGKIKTGDFDVFLCHNSEDKTEVKEIGNKLKEYGILPWLDEWELQPGLPWQDELEKVLEQIKSAAVFIGKDGIGPWQQQELSAFLREFVDRKCPVIPVLLPSAPKKPNLPIFLKGMTWSDFRKDKPNPLEQLIWGITGERRFDRIRFKSKGN